MIADGARAVLDNRPAFLRTAKALADFFTEVLENAALRFSGGSATSLSATGAPEEVRCR